MPHQIHYSSILNTNVLTKAQLIERLSVLRGCVYLENNANPTIGFLPKAYLIQYSENIEVYQRIDNLDYVLDHDISDLQDFVKLETSSRHQHKSHPDFNGGYIGFFDYNAMANLQIKTKLADQPNLFFGLYESFLRYEQGNWIFYSTEANAKIIFDKIQSCLQDDIQQDFFLSTVIEARWSKEQYQQAFEKVQQYIVAGDCYQINLTQAFEAKSQGKLIATAEAFWQLTNPPYAAYLQVNDFELLSCSPELFVEFKANREILTKPIKGTMPRYENAELDEASKQALINSEKDQAENLMIVDLLRNDLSLYAEIGTVKTNKLFNIESFNQVHHMVSEISATLKNNIHPLQVLMDALPGGSITGAPKFRAMEIIEELEIGPRGAYCGSIGYFNFDGTGIWNILIRTIQKHGDNTSIWAGGGVTIASECDAEYQECFDKVEAMLDLLNTWHKPN